MTGLAGDDSVESRYFWLLVLHEWPKLLTYGTQARHGWLDPAISIGWLLTGIASFANWCG